MNPLTLDEAITRAREWRAETSCSPAAAVAIALLNRLEELGAQEAARGMRRFLAPKTTPIRAVRLFGGPLHGKTIALTDPSCTLPFTLNGKTGRYKNGVWASVA